MVLRLSGPTYPIERNRATPDAFVSYLYQRQSPAKSCTLPSKASNCNDACIDVCIDPCAPPGTSSPHPLSVTCPRHKTL